MGGRLMPALSVALNGYVQLVLSLPLVRSRKGRGHLLGEAVCSGEDPRWCDETAPTEVGPIALDADLPGPLAF